MIRVKHVTLANVAVAFGLMWWFLLWFCVTWVCLTWVVGGR